jgi:hypothetical protein
VFVKHCKEIVIVNKKLYIAFVDLLKAFDSVNWNVMIKILQMLKTDYRDRIVRELYKNSNDIYKNIIK